jgi:choline dehydrogenase-like flavoprotein
VNKPVSEVRLAVVLDQAPNPASRVTLSTERDAPGMPKVRLDWRLSEADERSMEALALTVAGELARLGLGRVQLHEAVTPASGWARAGNLTGYGVAPDAPEMKISWHHIGTTRMAATPEDGVVDGDCRVHGVQNLFVAGSSVFPTAGNANPTLTIVALALRLADHLKADGLPDVAGLPLRQG